MKKSNLWLLAVIASGLIGMSAHAEDASGSTSFWEKTKVTGQFNSSYNYNFNNPTAGAENTPLRIFDPNSNDFDFNLAEIAIENSPVDWAKFRLDLNYGEDVALVDSVKGGNIGNGVAGDDIAGDEFGVQQAYAELTAPIGNGLTFKIGHFVTPIGYEVIESAYNLNTSRSFLFGLAIPFTHTGVIASYPVTDKLTTSVGVLNGWDVVADNNKGKTIFGQFVYKASDTLTLSVQGTVGPEGVGEGNQRGLVDVVANWTPSEDWLVGFNYDWAKEEGVGCTGITCWQGGALYVHHKVSDAFGVTVRGEYFDDDGSRMTAAGVPGGLANVDLVEGTLTGHFYMGDGWETRLEYRHDHEVDGQNPFFNTAGAQAKSFQDTVSAEVVYAF